ncbi:hypothetical protein K9M18_04020 [Candidatus Woesearchaeota archaeon]|nr:hypothetical protein [Candidatus Woesearchaeota archaeon]MCF8013583.1 hypothetical protein [Candidatus Woesearchaeota archaeon]
MKIPALDTIHFTEHGIRTPINNNPHITITIDDKEETHKIDSKVESFITYKINPEEIIDIYKSDIKTSMWNGKLSKNKLI